jgi:hypothetical protein
VYIGLSLRSYPTEEPVKEAMWRALYYNSDRSSKTLSSKTVGSFDEWHSILTSTQTANKLNVNIFLVPAFSGREQRPLLPELRASKPEQSLSKP